MGVGLLLHPGRVLLLHPGEMGASVGAALRNRGLDVGWVRADRSEASAERAAKADLHPWADLPEGLSQADAVLSVCPPDAALDLSRAVHAVGFRGRFVDGNAISPSTARALHELWGEAFVDGGLVGPPAWRAGSTRFFLSGAHAAEVAEWFAGSPLEAVVIEGGPGAASALKMAYAGWTKGSAALLLAIRALAEREGVTEALLDEWDRSQTGLRDRSEATARGVGPKAWRFEGEMREIAATFEAAGLPAGFHEAAAEVYGRLAGLKDTDDGDLADVLRRLLASSDG